MKRSKRTMVVMAVVGAFGCSDGGELRTLTYNVALAPGDAPLSAERVQPIAEALAEADADVICLQEVWTADDFEALVAAGSYEETVRLPDGAPGVCLEGDLDALEACVSEPCAGICGVELVGCAMANCGPELDALVNLTDEMGEPTGCSSCVVQEVSGGACIEAVRPACETGTPSSYIYTGHDTALLSRLPVLESEAFALDSYKVRTAVSYARVDSELGPVDVFCAHWASPIDDIPYLGDHGSWREERTFQIQQTLDFIAERSTDGTPIVLLGDLNVRVGSDELAPVEGLGLHDAADDAGEPGCTLCSTNTLSPTETEVRVDHAYLDTSLTASVLEVVFDETQPVAEETVHLSDHYGLRAVLRN